MSLPGSSDCERQFGGAAAVGFLIAIVVTAACRAGELTVSVIDRTGHGVADVVVVVAPAEPATSPSGHAWTAAWTHDLGAQWQLAAEWIRVTSRFPPRAGYGELPANVESQTQVAIRYRFTAGL